MSTTSHPDIVRPRLARVGPRWPGGFSIFHRRFPGRLFAGDSSSSVVGALAGDSVGGVAGDAIHVGRDYVRIPVGGSANAA